MIARAPRVGALRGRTTDERPRRALFRRFLDEDAGQDLVEYALLATFVALASIAAMAAIQTGLGAAYESWGSKTQLLSCMPDPGGGGCP